MLLAYDNQYAYKNGRGIIDRLSWRFILAGEIKLTDIESWHKGAQVELQKFVNKLQETWCRFGYAVWTCINTA